MSVIVALALSWLIFYMAGRASLLLQSSRQGFAEHTQ